jgi:MgtE intracellular N domain
MKIPIVAAAAAILSWGVATAQTGPPVAPAVAPGQSFPTAAAPDATADIWSHMTSEQRKQLWQQLTPEERATIWGRLPAEQRRAIRERLTPEQRESIREHWGAAPQPLGPQGPPGPGSLPEPRPGSPADRIAPPPGPKLSPEERRQLREEIRRAQEFRRGRRRP